jgi:hypothetical protein
VLPAANAAEAKPAAAITLTDVSKSLFIPLFIAAPFPNKRHRRHAGSVDNIPQTTAALALPRSLGTTRIFDYSPPAEIIALFFFDPPLRGPARTRLGVARQRGITRSGWHRIAGNATLTIPCSDVIPGEAAGRLKAEWRPSSRRRADIAPGGRATRQD